ncbi:hypothetical protein D3C81_1375480 [compost metagenome]
MAAAPVVLFQNIPSKNIAKTPGLIKPVYFWIKVNPPAPPMPSASFQVNKTESRIEITIVIFPTQTIFASLASLLMYFLKISSVKIVAILFAFPANPATIAAVSAASASPFIPFGR